MLHPLQQGFKRRTIRSVLADPGLITLLAAPLDTATNASMKTAAAADVQAAMNGDYSAFIASTQQNLVSQGQDATVVNSSPFIDLLTQLFAQLMPMLLSCLSPAPTPAQVLAAIQ